MYLCWFDGKQTTDGSIENITLKDTQSFHNTHFSLDFINPGQVCSDYLKLFILSNDI